MRTSSGSARLWVAALGLAACVPWLQGRLEARLGRYRAQEELLYFSSAEHVRRVFPGFQSLLADLYWLRVVQYAGGVRQDGSSRPKLALLEPLIDTVVALDPRFRAAYICGATFLAAQPPFGPGRPQAAVQLLERGVREFPRDWYMHQHLGFTIWAELGDRVRAGERLWAASRMPGAATWLKFMAAGMFEKGGEREKSRQIWRYVMETAEDETVRDDARWRLARVDAMDDLDRLNAAAHEFMQRRGRPAAHAQELVSATRATLPLVDPTGVPYLYEAATGRFVVKFGSRAWGPAIGEAPPPPNGEAAGSTPVR